MSEKIGLDKDKISELLEKVQIAWNDFFWEYRVCQRHIRFTDEERSNYVGDLINYFNDTLHHLETFRYQPDYLSSLYEAIATLQIMFIQQDLIDDILGLFKLGKSSSNDKVFIRQLRNELIGHPISRGANYELISSVFITGSTKNSTLSYIRYHKNNSYKHDLVTLDWKDIFKKHETYLNYFFDIILEKIIEIISHFERELSRLKTSAKQISFPKLVAWTRQIFESYIDDFPLFASGNIMLCYEKQETHPRYKYAVNLFNDGIEEAINGIIWSIDYWKDKKKYISANQPIVQHKIEFVSHSSNQTKKENKKNQTEKIDYYFGKLYEKEHPFGIDYFKRTFQHDAEIMAELNNMTMPPEHRNVEFYASYEYLRTIFEQRGML